MLRGDKAAYERFFNVAYPAMYRFALARLDFDRDAASDIAQSTVCKAVRNLASFRGEAALLTCAVLPTCGLTFRRGGDQLIIATLAR